MMLHKRIYQFFIALIFLTACSADLNSHLTMIDGYAYDQLKTHGLANPLKEISGLAYYAPTNSFVAINDEKGIVYVLDPTTFEITNKHTFADEGDYEEIQVFGDLIYVLQSNGKVYKINFNGKQLSNITSFKYEGPKAEYESFYIDTHSKTLVLIPKNFKEGTKAKQTVTYTIDAETGKYVEKDEHILPWSTLRSTSIIHPSAVAIHPTSQKIYLLVSVEKRLIVMDANWKILEEYELNPKTFQQPEGITFDLKGNLYISNEGADKTPTIIQIPISKN